MGRRRKNGDGTIRFRESDGRWEGRLIIGYDEHGKAIKKTVTAKTKTECEKKLNKIKSTTNVVVKEKNKPEMPFGDWMDFWYKNYCKPALRAYTQ